MYVESNVLVIDAYNNRELFSILCAENSLFASVLLLYIYTENSGPAFDAYIKSGPIGPLLPRVAHYYFGSFE